MPALIAGGEGEACLEVAILDHTNLQALHRQDVGDLPCVEIGEVDLTDEALPGFGIWTGYAFPARGEIGSEEL